MNNEDTTLDDAYIRSALRLQLLEQYGSGVDTVLIEELCLCRGQARVDMVVVNGYLHGYEIKSDRDSLRRLAKQVERYGKVLDHAMLVVADRHLDPALEMLPDWWGVLHFQRTARGPRFKTMRRGRRNPQRDPRSLVELLWLDQAITLLEQRNAARGVRGKPRRIVWDRVCEYFNVDEIATAVRNCLKARAEHSSFLSRS